MLNGRAVSTNDVRKLGQVVNEQYAKSRRKRRKRMFAKLQTSINNNHQKINNEILTKRSNGKSATNQTSKTSSVSSHLSNRTQNSSSQHHRYSSSSESVNASKPLHSQKGRMTSSRARKCRPLRRRGAAGRGPQGFVRTQLAGFVEAGDKWAWNSFPFLCIRGTTEDDHDPDD